MRLTTVILIASLMQLSAATFGQRITMNYKNTALNQVLKELRKQSGYDIFYDQKSISPSLKVSVAVKEASVTETLSETLKGLNLSFDIEDKVITIRRKVATTQQRTSSIDGASSENREVNLTAYIRDSKGNPLIGATVLVKGTDLGAATDATGRFIIIGAPESGTLIVRMIGMESREISYKNSVVQDITLKDVNSELSEVQVIAYGKVQRKFSTSNIGTIKAEEIQRQPVSNPLLTLAGRVPGLFIKQMSGITAGNVQVNIQGANSLKNSNDPFYVIDGVPYSSTFSGSLGGNATGGSGSNPFNFINPSDIESISILKDADATAIYGSRAANGAILITTKKGVAGKTNVNFNLQNGWGKVTRKADLVNTQEYLELRKEGYVNDGIPVPKPGDTPFGSDYDLTFWDQDKYTDLQDKFIGGTAKFTDLQGSVTGGSENTQFLLSYGYHNETTVYPKELYDRKGNVRFNLNHKSADNRFKIMFNGSYLQQQNTLGSLDLANKVNQFAPNIPDLYLADGSLNWAYLPDGTTSTLTNPLWYLEERYTGKSGNLIADNSISYEIIRGLNVKTTLGYTKLNGNETLFTPLSAFPPALPTANKIRAAQYLDKSIETWIAEPQLTYTKSTDFGVFDALLGTTFQQSKTSLIRQSGSGYATDASLPDITSATTRSINAVEYDLYKYTAAFGRLNYRLHDKYIINLNLRRDGSSRFGPESRFHTFYAIGGAWIFGDEGVVKRTLPWLSFAKLRGSYGTTGNDQIGNYRFLSLLDNYTAAQMLYQDGLSLQVNKIDNLFLQWEETRKLNVGLDFGFWDNRIMVNLTYARNRSSNQLISDKLPTITGADVVDINFPALVQNTSYEVQMNITPVRTAAFNWTFSGNLTMPKNRLIDFPNLIGSSYENDYIIGQPISIRRVYGFAGVDPDKGIYQYYTAKGQLTSNPSDEDRKLTVNVDPKFYGGISNSFSYKGLQLDFLFQFVKQQGPIQRYSKTFGFIGDVPLRSALDRWQKPGDITDIQKIGSSEESFLAAIGIGNSEAAYGDVSYVRLKNASLSYALPQKLITKVKMSNARVYVQGQNLLTFTNFYGSDPETPPGGLPPLKMLTLGLQVTF